MRIRRIEIPAYRVLRDVDMRFDGGHVPQIFPIGSENGGGKSTLLQVLFVLLHCAGMPERRAYLRNLLVNGACEEDGPETVFARLSLEVDGESVTLEFVVLRFDALLSGFGDDVPSLGFTIFDELARLRRKSDRAETALQSILAIKKTLDSRPEADPSTALARLPGSLIEAAGLRGLRLHRRAGEPTLRMIDQHHERTAAEVEALRSLVKDLEGWRDRTDALLKARGEKRLAIFGTDEKEYKRALVVRIPGVVADVARVLTRVRSSIFLLGPSNQQYLFLDRPSRRALVNASSLTYLGELNEAEAKLPAFFAYDWLSFEPLVKLFADARDRDFREVVESGAYGNHYTRMLADVNALLTGKGVRPLPDLNGIEFATKRSDGTEVILGPEDLSRGELKRLMIYAWLKANNATDAVVLIDEVEASFHPDWQYRIIRDLQEWAPGNQYLLATHSYELCTALTPAHVRELEPRLREGRPGDDPDES